MNAYIKATKGNKTKTFTIKVWNNHPKGHYGWRETSDYISPEAAEIESIKLNKLDSDQKDTEFKPSSLINESTLESMSGKELQQYIIDNDIQIDGYKSMPKAKLLIAIKEYQDAK